MALTAAEEAQTRELLAQQASILSLADSEAAIISNLGATDVSLSDLTAATAVDDADLLLIRQGVTDKSVSGSIIKGLASVPDASETVKGIVELATVAEAQAGVDTTRVVTPAGLASILFVPKSLITGMIPTAISGTSTTAAVTISSGQASNSTGVKNLVGPGHSWAVSNGNAANGYQGGATLPNSSTIHFFECFGSSGYCSFASTSLTPTLPTGYSTNYRRIFSLNTTAAGALVPGSASEVTGGAMQIHWTTQILDVSATPTSASRTLYALTVPSGIKVQPIGRANWAGMGASNGGILTSPDETDVAPTAGVAGLPGFDGFWNASSVSSPTSMAKPLLTDTSGRIGIRSAAASGTAQWITSGFIDFRRA